MVATEPTAENIVKYEWIKIDDRGFHYMVGLLCNPNAQAQIRSMKQVFEGHCQLWVAVWTDWQNWFERFCWFWLGKRCFRQKVLLRFSVFGSQWTCIPSHWKKEKKNFRCYLSSTEAEYIALSEAVKEAASLQGLTLSLVKIMPVSQIKVLSISVKEQYCFQVSEKCLQTVFTILWLTQNQFDAKTTYMSAMA